MFSVGRFSLPPNGVPSSSIGVPPPGLPGPPPPGVLSLREYFLRVHRKNSSSLVYNNEISLSSVIALAYYTACKDYTIIREMPTGNGFSDMVFLPKRTSTKPALVLELKWDKSAEGAISQIKNKNYAGALEDYRWL